MLTNARWEVQFVKTQLGFDSEWDKVVSSAYFRCGVRGDKSLINAFQRRGPSTVPWKTPIFIDELKMDFVLRNLTHRSLLERKSWTVATGDPSIFSFKSFLTARSGRIFLSNICTKRCLRYWMTLDSALHRLFFGHNALYPVWTDFLVSINLSWIKIEGYVFALFFTKQT